MPDYKKIPAGHKDYGKMGPLKKSDYESLNFKNSVIDKLNKDVKTGPSGQSYSQSFLDWQSKQKVKA